MSELPDKYIEMIKKEFEIQNETEELNAKLPSVISEVHTIFRKYGINQKILSSDVMFGKKFFGNRIIINWDIATRERVVILQTTQNKFEQTETNPNTTLIRHYRYFWLLLSCPFFSIFIVFSNLILYLINFILISRYKSGETMKHFETKGTILNLIAPFSKHEITIYLFCQQVFYCRQLQSR